MTTEQEQQLDKVIRALGGDFEIEDGGLKLEQSVPILNLVAFFDSAEIDSDLTSLLPDGLLNLGDVQLAEFRFRAELGLTIGLLWPGAPDWQLTDKFDPLPKPQDIRVTLIKPALGGRLAVHVGGTLHFGTIVVDFQASYPDRSLTVSASPRTEEAWVLTTLLDELPLPNDFGDSLPDLSIERFILSGDLQANNFTFQLFVSTQASTAVSLDNLILQLNYINGEASGALAATAVIDNVTFNTGASYEPVEGWLFYGESAANQDLKVDDWLAQFASTLGQTPTPPPPLQDLTVSNATISFALTSLTAGTINDAAFGCEVAFPVNGRDVNLLLDIEKNGDEVSFTAGVQLGELFLTGEFVSSDGNDMLVAVFQAPTNEAVGNLGFTVGLHALLEQALPGAMDFMPDAAITLNSAAFAYQAASANQPALVTLMLDVASPIDFSGLDLVGPYISDLTLAFQLYLTTTAVTNATATQIDQTVTKLASSFELIVIDPVPTGTAEPYTIPTFARDAADNGAIALTPGLTMRGQLESAAFGPDGLALLAPFTRADADPLPAGDEGAGKDAQATALAPSNEVSWINIDRTFGAVYFSRLGITYSPDDGLLFVLDMSLAAGPLTLILYGLSVGTPLDGFRPRFGLGGFGLQYRRPPLAIGGSFAYDATQSEFSGAALIQASTFAVTALGAYSQPADGPASMFLYAFLDKPLGGPAFFFVEGLALGFGYNRDITLPDVAEVADFPLVAVARGAGGDNSSSVLNNLTSGSQPLAPVKPDAYWIAAGVKFNSFKLLDSFALAVFRFGREFEITLLGLSTLVLPKGSGANAKVHAEIAFRVSLKPGQGLVAAEGRLTENSYVLEPAARLTGGFAFYLWFDGTYAGDFVLTLGGYHPKFLPPSHYPRVPRLELNWPIDDNLHIIGQAYFALTPSSVMAGGRLEATYEKGDILATFTAYADFIMGWKPFYYQAQIGLSLLASYGIFEAELRADIEIWGPEFAGIAEITWTVFSFTIAFGPQQKLEPSQTLIWSAFKQAYLPSPTKTSDDDPEPKQQISRILIAGGLEEELDMTGKKVWVVRPDALNLATESAIPLTLIDADVTDEANLSIDFELDSGPVVGIRPMDSGAVLSRQTITITSTDGGSSDKVDLRQWTMTTRRSGVPAELWQAEVAEPLRVRVGDTTIEIDIPKPPSADVLPNRLTGLASLRPPLPELGTATEAMSLANLSSTSLQNLLIPLRTATPTTNLPAVNQSATFTAVTNAIQANHTNRDEMLTVIHAAGYALSGSGQQLQLVAEMETAYGEPPMLAQLGANGFRRPATVTLAPAPEPATAVPPDLSHTIFVRLMAILFQYLGGGHMVIDGTTTELSDPTAASATVARVTSPARAGTARPAFPTFTPPPVSTRSEPLTVGRTLLWEIERPSQGIAGALQLAFNVPDSTVEGDIPRVRIVALNRYSRLLLDAVQPANEALVLPADTRFLAVRGLRPQPSAGNAVGWRGAENLLQVQPRLLLAEKALLRPQAARRRKLGGRLYSFGLVSGQTVVADNLVYDADGVSRVGWIETLLPKQITENLPVRAVAILLKKAPHVAGSDLPGRPTVHGRLQNGQPINIALQGRPFSEDTTGQIQVFISRPLTNMAVEDGYLRLRVQVPDPNWQLHGVIGINLLPINRSQWLRIRLESEALPETGTHPATIDVRLTF